jgi:hypothetical protein
MVRDNVLSAKWSKKEGDIMIHYPSSPDGHLLHNVLAAKHYHPLAKVWDNLSFREELIARGYDITTLKFSIEKIQETKNALCLQCEFAQWEEGEWGICLQSPKERNNISKILPEVRCPIGKK